MAQDANRIPIRNLWHMLFYAWRHLDPRRHLERNRQDCENAPSLDGLLATILAYLVRQQIRIGLGRNYRRHSALLRRLRGRIDFAQSLKRLAFENAQAYCRFEEFSVNVPKNQILFATLTYLLRHGDFAPDKDEEQKLRDSLRRLLRDLAGIDLLTPKAALELIRLQTLGRNDGDYRLMLMFCQLILSRHMPTEEAGDKILRAIKRDTQTLHEIYELFVANFYRINLERRGWTVSTQKTFRWHDKHGDRVTHPHMPAMRPDVVLEHSASHRRIVLDTKFKRGAFVPNQQQQEKARSSDLYQIYAYVRSQAGREGWNETEGVLLYPMAAADAASDAAPDTRPVAASVDIQGHRFRFETLDLRAPWQEIETRLTGLVERTASLPPAPS